MTNSKSRIFARVGVMAMLVAVVAPLVASAATISSGNLTLGDPRPGQTTTYAFSGSGFTTGTQIRCIQMKLNTQADGSGTVPTNLTHASATVSANTIAAGLTTVDNTEAGSLRATSATLTTPSASGSVTWSTVVSGTVADTTYYGIVTTYALQNCTGTAVDSTVIAFRYTDGALVSMTIDPTMTFSVAGVANGTVNGASITASSTPTAINFARTVNATTNGVSAHDLTVLTNAGGSTVNLRQLGALTNGTNTIAASSGSNAAPAAFPAAGTAAWGYTTNDFALVTGTAGRFSSNLWAGMPTTNELVMDTAVAGTQTTRVGHQLGVASTTPAGTYTTTLVYSAAGTY